MINEARHVDDAVLQHQQRQGEGENGCEGFECKMPAHLEKAEDGQGNVDNQRDVAHAEIKQILDHGGNAVDTGGGKRVMQDKYLIIQRHQHGGKCDNQVLERQLALLLCGHIRASLKECPHIIAPLP